MAPKTYIMSTKTPSATADRRKKFLGLALCLVLFTAATAGQMDANSKKEISEEGLTELFNAALFHVRNDYVDDVSRQQLLFGAIRGMLGALDDAHTRFMTAEETTELQTEMRGNFGGLGIEISQRDNVLTVVSPIEDTPAMRAGIKPGDKIIEIDKKTTRDVSLSDAVKQLRGKPGTSVNISVVREGEDEMLSFDLVREVIKIQVVTSQYLDKERLGYVRLKQFNQTAHRRPREKRSPTSRKRRLRDSFSTCAGTRAACLTQPTASAISSLSRVSSYQRAVAKKETRSGIQRRPLGGDRCRHAAHYSGKMRAPPRRARLSPGRSKTHKRGKFIGVKNLRQRGRCRMLSA
jgi:hypothetical protein